MYSDGMFYNSIIYVNIAVGSVCIALQHINGRVPSATHVACFPVVYIFLVLCICSYFY
jgi:hypothetical protein